MMASVLRLPLRTRTHSPATRINGRAAFNDANSPNQNRPVCVQRAWATTARYQGSNVVSVVAAMRTMSSQTLPDVSVVLA